MLKTKMTMNQGEELYRKYIGNWREKLVEYRFEGYKADKLIKTSIKSAVTKPALEVSVDSTELVEDSTYDAARVVVKALCGNKNVLPYANDVFKIMTEGLIEIIGKDAFSLMGGVRGFYIKTKGKSGTAYDSFKIFRRAFHRYKCNKEGFRTLRFSLKGIN